MTGTLRALLALPAALLLVACPAGLDELDTLKTLQAAGNHAGIAARAAPCTGSAAECIQAQEIRADACRRLSLAAPADSPERTARGQCAVTAFAAAASGRGEAAPRSLLVNLGNAANDGVGFRGSDKGAMIAAELDAAAGLLRGNPRDPEGCYFAGSARLAQALQIVPPGPARCTPLAAIPASCRDAPAPAGRSAEAASLAAQVAAQRRTAACP